MKETEIKTSDTEEKRRKRKCSVIRKATQWIEEGGRSGDKNKYRKENQKISQRERKVV
jgi:hypothetical protein